MLVLTRKINQEIAIADNIRVKVLEVRGNQVRLGIIAPKEISIHRVEKSANPGKKIMAPISDTQRCNGQEHQYCI